MTKHHYMENTDEAKSINYPFLVDSNHLYLAEDSDDYHVNLSKNEPLALELKQVELRALRTTASAQIGRLYRLANLLLEAESIENSKDESKQIALEVRNAASLLEDSLHAIVGSIVDDPEPGQEEIAE